MLTAEEISTISYDVITLYEEEIKILSKNIKDSLVKKLKDAGITTFKQAANSPELNIAAQLISGRIESSIEMDIVFSCLDFNKE